MKQTKPLPPRHESEQHYSVPEGYFDDLEERLLKSLPQEDEMPPVEEANPTLWVRLRPILYMAAMFVTMSLLFRAFHSSQSKPTTPAVAKTEQTARPAGDTAKASEAAWEDYYTDYGARATAGEGYSAYYGELVALNDTQAN